MKNGLRPSALFGLEKREKWRPNGALDPYGFSKNKSNHVGSVKTNFLIMVFKKNSVYLHWSNSAGDGYERDDKALLEKIES